MPEPVNRIAEFRKARKLTQQQLADAVGAHWITISKLERGKMQLSYDWAAKLGKALGVGRYELYARQETARTIFLDGVIADRGEVAYYRDDQGIAQTEAILVEFGPQEKGLDLWLVVQSQDFYPLLHEFDIIRATYMSLEMLPSCIGRLVVAGEKDGPQLLGILSPGQSPGSHQVRALNGAPRPDVMLDDLALVTMILPYPDVSDQETAAEKDRS